MILFSEQFDVSALSDTSFMPVVFKIFQQSQGFNRTREIKFLGDHNENKKLVSYQYECLFSKPIENISFFFKAYYNGFTKVLTILAFHPFVDENDSSGKQIESSFNEFVEALTIANIIKNKSHKPPLIFTF